MLEQYGMKVVYAENGHEGIERLGQHTVTAKAMQRDREKAVAAGASDYIAKPVDVDQLMTMMRAWLAAAP
jgi:response regulator RpfG family c-di-GMP phosphodiesterase